jgi:2-methylcitrate dehydratase PrpD
MSWSGQGPGGRRGYHHGNLRALIQAALDLIATGYADLPVSAVESARRDILDTFGCMLGGSGSPGIDELFAVISRWGGLEESRVLLRGIRLPAPQAALLNASMGHALRSGSCRPNSPVAVIV